MQKFVKFARYTFQGIAVASLGTLGVTPKWESFVLGVAALILAMVLLTKED